MTNMCPQCGLPLMQGGGIVDHHTIGGPRCLYVQLTDATARIAELKTENEQLRTILAAATDFHVGTFPVGMILPWGGKSNTCFFLCVEQSGCNWIVICNPIGPPGLNRHVLTHNGFWKQEPKIRNQWSVDCRWDTLEKAWEVAKAVTKD